MGKYQDCHFTPPIMKNMGKEFCVNLLQFYENTARVRDSYSIILESYEHEQANLDAKLEEEKRQGKDIDSASSLNSKSSKKKSKGKAMKKSVSTSDKKRSHSAEPKQLKPTKKKSTASQNNSKPTKGKKKK